MLVRDVVPVLLKSYEEIHEVMVQNKPVDARLESQIFFITSSLHRVLCHMCNSIAISSGLLAEKAHDWRTKFAETGYPCYALEQLVRALNDPRGHPTFQAIPSRTDKSAATVRSRDFHVVRSSYWTANYYGVRSFGS